MLQHHSSYESIFYNILQSSTISIFYNYVVILLLLNTFAKTKSHWDEFLCYREVRYDDNEVPMTGRRCSPQCEVLAAHVRAAEAPVQRFPLKSEPKN